MSGIAKPKPLQAFEANMADAHHLVQMVEAFTNQRVRRMRSELRSKLGQALGVRSKDHASLDCLQSNDIFVVFMPTSRLGRDSFSDPRPLLRQSIVAACAATETYVGDKVMERIGPLARIPGAATKRLQRLQLTLGTWLEIDQQYQRKRWGLRELVIEPYVREQTSTSPNKIGEMLSMIGVENWAKQVDGQRGVASGETVKFLERVTARRNRIAHQGDRSGRGRAPLSIEEVNRDLEGLESVVHAIENVA